MHRNFLLALPLLLAACEPVATTTPRTQLEQQRDSAAKQASEAQTECNECNSILFKRQTLGTPGLIGYVVFLADDGRPVQYNTVKGKCTSGGKRLESNWDSIPLDRGEFYGTENVPGPADDGTYGSSGDYIYCRTTEDAYIQWNGKYLYSTQPFDLSIKPLVIATTSNPNATQGQ